MKFALIGPLPPLRGGIATYNNSLRKTLKSLGHDVLPISYRILYPSFLFPGTSQFDEEAESVDDSQNDLIPWNPLSWRKVVANIRRSGATHLIIQHWHPFFVPCLNFIARRALIDQVIVIAHNVLPHEKERIGRILNPVMFKASTRVIVGAGEQLKQLQNLVPEIPGTVVPHPVYAQLFTDPEADFQQLHLDARSELDIPLDLPYFVHLGLVRRYKGVDILLRAVKRIKSKYKLDVIGEFYERIGEYLALHNELELAEQVTLENRFLNDNEMRLRILAADAVVLPYRHATQSGIAMLTLAGGTPIIATSTGALTDIVVEGENGTLAQPEDADSFGEAISRFLDSGLISWRKKRNQIAANTRRDYSWETLARAIVEDV